MNIKKLKWHRSWSRRDKIFFLERMELFLSAGLTVDGALSTALEGMDREKKNDVIEIQRVIQGGGRLSVACGTTIRFSGAIISLIRQGESSGELNKALSMARALLEREDELIKKCVSALTYPVVIGVFAGLLVIGLMRGIMPQIVPMLKGLNVELPFLTRIVMWISDAISHYGLYAAVAGTVLLIGSIVWHRKNGRFRSVCQELTGRIPIVGRLIFSYHTSVFLYSCGALVESGFSVATAYIHTVKDSSFHPLKKILDKGLPQIERGVPLGHVFNGMRIPEYIPALISAGEQSGSLGLSLARAAGVLDRDIEHALKRLTSLIEPLMMAGMGCAVGVIALSIMMPIYDVSKVLQQ